MRRVSLLTLALMIAAAAATGAAGAQGGPPGEIHGLDHPDRIPGQYIVVLNRGTDLPRTANDLARTHGGRATRVYGAALHGFAMEIPDQAAKGLARNPNVAYVEADREISLSATQNNPPSWGLDRVDQRDLPLSNSYTFDFDGTGIHAYVIDTGIRDTHNDFGNRASRDFDAFGGNGSDCNGHGTHVAGTVGGAAHGVAKNVRLHGVRVLNCSGSGTLAGVIAGIDWVTANRINPAVANMSLGGGIATTLDAAVNNSVASGVFYAVAAGNNNGNACNTSPARAANAYTVGSTTQTDARSSFSNFGTCVNIFAPGTSITSAWHTSNSATNTISGTSMASPHVAGAAALVLHENSSLSPSQIASTLTTRATQGRLTGIGSGSPNLLLFTLGSGGGPGPGPGPGPTTVYSENFDSGSAAGWNKSSGSTDLWRLSTDCVSAASGSHKLAFSRPSPNCDYNVGSSAAVGWARSPVISLSGFTSATLSFNHFWQTESFSGGAFDIMRVQVSTNSGSTWTTIRQWDSRDANPSGYQAVDLNVSSFISSGFRVRFQFDSVDGVANNFLGWYVDDVKVTAE